MPASIDFRTCSLVWFEEFPYLISSWNGKIIQGARPKDNTRNKSTGLITAVTFGKNRAFPFVNLGEVLPISPINLRSFADFARPIRCEPSTVEPTKRVKTGNKP